MTIAAGHCTKPARNNVSEAPVKPCKNGGQKKTEVALCFFYSSLSGVQTGIPSGPSGGIPSPLVGSELRLCRPFATLFYLSTLPTASPSLPSAVGRSSVPVGIGNITKPSETVNIFLKKNWRVAVTRLYAGIHSSNRALTLAF